MFESHLDEQPIMTSPSGLGQEDQLPATATAGGASRDASIPQIAATGTYKSLITVLLLAGVTYLILKGMKSKNIAPDVTG